MGHGWVPAGLLETTLPGSDVPIYFVAEKHLFGHRPWLYGYRDDPYRFAFFSRAALDLAIAAMEWRPDVVHCHDWHTAIVPNWLKTVYKNDPFYAQTACVYTIHNLAYQGVFDGGGMFITGLGREHYNPAEFEHFGATG